MQAPVTIQKLLNNTLSDIRSKRNLTRVEIDPDLYLDMICQIGRELKPEFVLDPNNRKVFELLSLYFTNNPDFESTSKRWSLQKGIMLLGPVGSGKSFTMRLFNVIAGQIHFKAFRMESADFISDAFEIEGKQGISKYTHRSFFSHHSGNSLDPEKPIHLLIDDMGTEPRVSNHFGNQTSVIADVTKARYDYLHLGMLTHATTNLDWEDLRDVYGERVFSRFHEMFNVIILDGQDRRKSK